MDKQSNSTTVPVVSIKIADAMLNLETPMRQISHVVDILADALDDLLNTSALNDTLITLDNSQNVTITMSDREIDKIGFLVDDLAVRMTRLLRDFAAARDGERA